MSIFNRKSSKDKFREGMRDYLNIVKVASDVLAPMQNRGLLYNHKSKPLQTVIWGVSKVYDDYFSDGVKRGEITSGDFNAPNGIGIIGQFVYAMGFFGAHFDKMISTPFEDFFVLMVGSRVIEIATNDDEEGHKEEACFGLLFYANYIKQHYTNSKYANEINSGFSLLEGSIDLSDREFENYQKKYFTILRNSG